MKKTLEGESIVALQPETVGGHSSTKVGPISAMGAVLHYLVHPRTRKKAAAETRASTEGFEKPKRRASRSPMDAGITGGFSLLMDDQGARRRR